MEIKIVMDEDLFSKYISQWTKPKKKKKNLQLKIN